jgi:microcystin-dependent protein
MILPFYGSLSDIPRGWQLCDGSNGTPDLRNRFIVGAGSSYGLGNIGGEAAHRLTISEMPPHSHTTTITYYNENGGNIGNPWGSGNAGSPEGNYIFTTGNAGGNQPHENRPPYFALYWIMKI